MIRTTTHGHADGARVATIGVDLALIGSCIALTGRIAFTLTACAKRTEAIILIAAAGVGVAADGSYVAVVYGASAVDAVFACGALDRSVGRRSKRRLKCIPSCMRSNIRTVFPQEPQLFTSFLLFTHVLPHNDGVGDAHAITPCKLRLRKTAIKMGHIRQMVVVVSWVVVVVDVGVNVVVIAT